jgi:RNA polymerase sigma-70 factor, ECF subfamily
MTIEQIWQIYHTKLHHFILNRVNDNAIADELLQEVFIKIHLKIDTLQETDKLQSWIYQITRHVIIDYYRTHNKTVLELPVSETDDIETARQYIEACLIPMIQNLPEPYRQTLMLSEIEGKTQKQLAEQDGISISAVKSRVQRGRAKIKQQLLNCCHFEFDHQGKMIDFEQKNTKYDQC